MLDNFQDCQLCAILLKEGTWLILIMINQFVSIKIAKSLAGFCHPEKGNQQNHESPVKLSDLHFEENSCFKLFDDSATYTTIRCLKEEDLRSVWLIDIPKRGLDNTQTLAN